MAARFQPSSRRQAVTAVLIGTLLGAFAQILIKAGASQLVQATLLGKLWGMVTNAYIIFGYSLYGLFTVIFVYALRSEELSILYPVISLNYVWVTILSVLVFHESLTAVKLAGISCIVAGVSWLGWNHKG